MAEQLLEKEPSGIGTLSEKTLHKMIKKYIEPDTKLHEVPVWKYVADVWNEHGIYEIQTGSFTPLREKLEFLLDFTDVTVVMPLAAVKYQIKLDTATGEAGKPRRSPKKMKPIDSCRELVKIKYALDNPHFHLKLLMLEIEEFRTDERPKGVRRSRSGTYRLDRVVKKVLEEIDINVPRDFDCLIPDGLNDSFTIKEFAEAAKTTYANAQCAVTVLVYLERLIPCGKRARENLYKKADF